MTFKPLAGMLKQLHTRSEHFAASGHAFENGERGDHK